VCDWSSARGKGFQRRLRGWFEGSGCDVWVLRIAGLDASRYASFQVRGVSKPDEGPDELTRRYDEWLAYYEREGIDAIHHGVITMRRASGRENWVRMDDAPEMSGPCGESVLRGFLARDFLERFPGDQALLDARLRASSDLLCEQVVAPGHVDGARTTSSLRLAKGLLYAMEVDPRLATLASQLDGDQTLLEALMAVARGAGERLDVIVRQLLPKVRELVQRGFVVPTSTG